MTENLNNKKHNFLMMFLISLIMLIAFVGMEFLLYNFSSNKILCYIYQIGFLLIPSIIFVIISSTRKDTFPLILLLMFTQFYHNKLFNGVFLYYSNFISIGLILLGMLIHFIKFKPKFRLGSFFIPFIILLVPICISMLQMKYDLLELIGIIANVTLAIITYVFFISTIENPKMDEISFMVVGFSLSIVLSSTSLNILYLTFSKYFYRVSYNTYLLDALILFACPFAMYRLININSAKKFFIALLNIIIVVYLSSVTFLKGCSYIFVLVEILLMFLLALKKSSKKAPTIICFVITLILSSWAYIVYIGIVTPYEYIMCYIRDYYEKVMEIPYSIKERIDNDFKLFGPNYINGLGIVGDTLSKVGIIGLITYTLFTIYKYIKLLKARTTGTIIAAISFFTSGCILLFASVFYSYGYLMILLFTICALEYKSNEELLCEYGDEDN